MIGQNRQAAFQQAKAEHDFVEQELELKTNTELTRAIRRSPADTALVGRSFTCASTGHPFDFCAGSDARCAAAA